MLPDWLENLVTPCPRHLRAMGYLRELLNIKKCLGWWGWAWATHFKQTQTVIRSAIAQCSSRRKAVILGSGWLHDVPLDDLARAFREVILVDVIHPLATRWHVRRHANVRLLTSDITESVEPIYRFAHTPGTTLPRAAPNLFCDDPEIDLAASVNILSQLPYLPVHYLRRAGIHRDEAIEAYARDVVRGHLDYLSRLPGTVALIADFEKRIVSRAGKVIERTSTIHDVDIPWKGDVWTWRLVPQLASDPTLSQRRVVVGIPNLKAAPAVQTATGP